MDKWLAEWENLTSQMVGSLEEADIDSLVAFVNKRETIKEQLQNSSITEQQRINWQSTSTRLLLYDRRILERMIELRDRSSRKINKIESARMQKNTYESGFTPGSVFFDRKK